MNFNSLEFLIFLPVVVALYWILPHKARWALLVIASYIFYMSWNVWTVFLILGTTVTAYAAAIFIGRAKSRRAKKAWLIITLVICLGTLVFFKYINFILESITGVARLFDAGVSGVTLDIILPVGISFYTFQTLSYVIDVYRGDFRAEKHFGYFALFVSYFPQLVAGPIERPSNLLPQLRAEHKINLEDFSEGSKWLLSGFFRKCVVADFCGIFVDKLFSDIGSANSLAVFAGSALFLVQIYNDFAGYSEIAIGSARLMGVKLTKNFDRPLTARSFTEFFRRWHITLNRWFTDYLYIPLGGNRKGLARKILNILIVFTLCGLWHGADWTYVLWGLYAGVLVGMEALLAKPLKNFCRRANIRGDCVGLNILRHVLIFVLFVFGCILFRSSDLSQAATAFSRMFTAFGFGTEYLSSAMSSLGMEAENIVQFAVIITAMALIYVFTKDEKEERLPLDGGAVRAKKSAMAAVFVFGILAVMMFWLGLLANSDVSGFVYFQF